MKCSLANRRQRRGRALQAGPILNALPNSGFPLRQGCETETGCVPTAELSLKSIAN